MRLALSMLAFVICLQLGYCQSDSNKIFTAATLKKGIYKNYQEFVNNAPSMTDQFSVIPLMASKRNPTIIGAEYKLDDLFQSVHGVWGFCDGQYV